MQPANTKFRKFRKVKPSGMSDIGSTVAFGLYAIKSTESGSIQGKHIETARRILSKGVKKTGRINIRIFPHIPVTRKPAEVRMGNGKGGVEFYIAPIQAGRVLFEFDGISEIDARELHAKVACKLPVSTVFVKRHFALEKL